MKPIEIISQAQSILARYLPPDGITQHQCINELLALLDGPEAVQLTMKQPEQSKVTEALHRWKQDSEMLKGMFASATELKAAPPTLLILTTESVAEVLHDEHALHTLPQFTLWRGKAHKPEHAAECQRWRAIAEKFTSHLMRWFNASGVPSSEVNMTSACVAVSAENTARANRLQDELNRACARENHLINERDRLIHQDIANLREELKATKEVLALSNERERQLSELLANIAAQVSGL